MADLGDDNANANSNNDKSKPGFLAQPKFLKAPVLNNPFAGVPSDERPGKSTLSNPFASVPTEDSVSTEGTKSDIGEQTKENKNEIVPKFVPLHTSKESISFPGSSVTAPTPTGLSRATGFVFGQNIKERVVVSSENAGEGTSNSTAKHSATNGSAELLFSAAVRPAVDSQSTSKEDGDSLTKSAETWERMRESNRVLPLPQKVLTGEEGEINQLQMNCRLYAFEGGLWKERGRTQLRLNDSMNSSRLVCRSAGSLRILINTKIWSGMTVERAGNKSLRVTATDSQQQLKVFLIMASPDEISHLYKALIRRVEIATHSNEIDDNVPENVADQDEVHNISTSDADDSNAKCDEKTDDDSESSVSTKHNTSVDSQSSSTPVVVISAEEDENSTNNKETFKRAGSEEKIITPKKLCMEIPSEDDAKL